MDPQQRDERLVAEFLRPLSEVRPASQPAARRTRRTVGRVAAVAAVAVCLGTGGALAATGVFGPLHDATVQPPANPISCSDLIGRPVDKAIRFFSAHDISVSWRYETFGTTVVKPSHPDEPTAVVGGRSTEVARPPRAPSSSRPNRSGVEVPSESSPSRSTAMTGCPAGRTPVRLLRRRTPSGQS